MDLKELNALLVEKGEAFVHYVFPDSDMRIKGGRYTIGNIDGSEGESFCVFLKSGRFKDFSTNEGGDFLELLMLKQGSRKAGIDAAYAFLGKPRLSNKIMSSVTKKEKKEREFKKPDKDYEDIKRDSEAATYLNKERGIPFAILAANGVKQHGERNAYGFATYTHDPTPRICGINYTEVKRKKVVKNGKKILKKIVWQSKEPLSTLYGHVTCEMDQKDKNGKRFVIITEGQIDCLSFKAQNINNVVSIPFGASDMGWIENSWDFLTKNFDEIYLCFDNDEAGQSFTERVSNRIGPERCKKIQIPPKWKDANEAHVNGAQLTEYVYKAIDFKPDKLVSAAEVIDDAISSMEKGRREQQGIPFLGWEGEHSINFRIRPREMTIYTGFPGGGKSNILYQEAAYLLFVHGEAMVIASLEEDVHDILAILLIHALSFAYARGDKNCEKAFRDANKKIRDKLFFYHHRNRAPFKDVLETAEYAIRKHGAKHFIMDSIAKTDLNIEDNEQANEFMGLIVSSMNTTGAHYHVVAHSRKGNDKSFDEIPGLNEIKGTAAIGIETFNCITVWRNRIKEGTVSLARNKGWNGIDMSFRFQSRMDRDKGNERIIGDILRDQPDTLLIVNKQKVGGQTGQFDLWFNRENYRMRRAYNMEEEPYAKEEYEEYQRAKGGEDEEEEDRNF